MLKKSLIIVLGLVVLLILPGVVAAAETNLDCTKCHGSTVSGFQLPAVVRTAQCATCHNAGGHAYYTDEQGVMHFAVYVKDVGYFFSTESPQATPQTLHKAHSGDNGLAGNSKCSRCHGIVSCTSCHTSVAHITHSTTKYSAPMLNQANGLTYEYKPVTCASSLCHSSMPNVVRQRADSKQLCLSCHQVDSTGHTDVTAQHQTNFVLNPQYPCSDCHNSAMNVEHEMRADESGQNYNCYTCHNSDRPDVNSAIINKVKRCDACHTIHPDMERKHTSTFIYGPGDTVKTNCSSCHNNLLHTEHALRKDDNNNPLKCVTCHASTDPKVTNAITSHNTRCDACHSDTSHDTVHSTAPDEPSNIDPYCQVCHKNTLTQEHLANEKTQTDNSWTCATCHENSNKSILNAIATGDGNCMACHSEGHNALFAEKIPSDIPLYNDYQWSIPQSTTIWADENWMPPAFKETGKIVFSNRRAVQVSDIKTFYTEQLTQQNWNIIFAEIFNDQLKIEARKGNRYLVVYAYNTEEFNLGSTVSAGYRIKLIYK